MPTETAWQCPTKPTLPLRIRNAGFLRRRREYFDDHSSRYHFCFRVGQEEFDSILRRIEAAGIKYRSTVRGPVDMQINKQLGNVYWNEPDGHQWEMLTVSYARPAR